VVGNAVEGVSDHGTAIRLALWLGLAVGIGASHPPGFETKGPGARAKNALVFLVEHFVRIVVYVQYYTYQTATSFACWT